MTSPADSPNCAGALCTLSQLFALSQKITHPHIHAFMPTINLNIAVWCTRARFAFLSHCLCVCVCTSVIESYAANKKIYASQLFLLLSTKITFVSALSCIHSARRPRARGSTLFNFIFHAISCDCVRFSLYDCCTWHQHAIQIYLRTWQWSIYVHWCT